MALLEWSNLTLHVGTAKKQRIILDGISGDLQPNELTCIIGASGSGKTSLMNILSGRIASTLNAPFSVKVHLDGEKINPRDERAQCAYVMQDDALFPTSTPRESITMAAKLRKVAEPEKAVERVINALGLQSCADSMCGSRTIRGISGGERKRTSVALEIVSNPRLLFLDEPTSGLDAFAAFNCLTTLKDLAMKGHTIALTMHQPSSELFHLCDKVIFLCKGKVVYSGPVKAVADHFASFGYPNPADYNVCDHVTFLMQRLSGEELDRLTETASGKEITDGYPIKLSVFLSEEMRTCKTDYLAARRSPVLVQVKFLFKRELMDIYRDKGALGARLGMTIFLNVLYGFIFFGSADPTSDGYTKEAHFGALMMTAIGVMMGSAQPEILKFPLARPVFIRECAGGLYSMLSYVITKTLIDLPLLLAQSALTFLITYWLIGFQGNFLYLVLTAWVVTLCASSISIVIGSIVSDIARAMEIAPLVLVPQLLFAGFFIRISQIPTPLDYAQYVCFLKYGLNLFLLFEFRRPIMVPCGTTTCDAGKQLFEANDIEDTPWLYVLIMVAIFICFRVMTFIALWHTSKKAVY